MIEYESIKDMEDGLIDKKTKDLLILLEKINPSNQKYYLEKASFAATYKLRINIFSFTKKFKLSLPVTVVGYPLSIDRQGYTGDEKFLLDVLNRIKGFGIVLNMDKEIVKGARTLSTFIFSNRFESFDEYINSLRSSYRRRIKEALNKSKSISVERIDKSKFTRNHYRLYEEVYKRSKYKLELQPMDFFKEFKGEIYQFKDLNNEVVSFVLLNESDGILHFIFCGFKSEDIEKYDIYVNMLLFIVQEGIKREVPIINFGQTSEETKLKIGCSEFNKYIYAHHKNPLINGIIKKMLPYFTYKGYAVKHRAFKENI